MFKVSAKKTHNLITYNNQKNYLLTYNNTNISIPVQEESDLLKNNYIFIEQVYYKNIPIKYEVINNKITPILNNMGDIDIKDLSIKGRKNNPIESNINKYPFNFLDQFPSVTGSINISRSFGQYPEMRISLYADKDTINDIINTFSDYNIKYIVYDMSFRVQNISRNINLKSVFPNKEEQVSISFRGWWEKPMSELSKYTDNIVECDIVGEEFSDNVELTGYTSLYNLAEQVNVTYNGNNKQIKIPSTNVKRAGVSFASKLSEISYLNEEFIVYSKNSGIQTVPWNNSIVHKDYSGITNISNNITNPDLNIPPTQLNILPPYLDKPVNSRPDFTYKKPKQSTTNTNPKASNLPNDITTLKNIELVFDISGRTETNIEKTFEGQDIIGEVISIYGLLYTAEDILNGSKLYANAARFWTKIEERTVTHVYDSNTGYYLGSNTRGWKYARFQKETEQLETITLDRSDLNVAAEYQTYLFKKIPITGNSRYILKAYANYYTDIEEDPYIDYVQCFNGVAVTKKTKDPNYRVKRFISDTSEYIKAFDYTTNPENLILTAEDISNGEIYKPPLTTGKEQLSTSMIKLNRSENTRSITFGDMFLQSSLGSYGDKDSYSLFTYNQISEEYGFNRMKKEEKEQEFSSRPSEAKYRDSGYIPKEQDKKLNTNEHPVNYWIYSDPYNKDSPRAGSVSIDERNPEKAISIYKTRKEMEYLRNNTITCELNNPNPYILEGSLFEGQVNSIFNNIKLRVLTSSTNYILQGRTDSGFIITGSTNLTLGVNSDLSDKIKYFTESKILKEKTEFILKQTYRDLGELLNLVGYKSTRGNYL